MPKVLIPVEVDVLDLIRAHALPGETWSETFRRRFSPTEACSAATTTTVSATPATAEADTAPATRDEAARDRAVATRARRCHPPVAGRPPAQ